MKPQVFIGCASECEKLGKIVKEYLEPMCECTIWNNSFFEWNTSTYDNLIKKSICFDYAVFIGGEDDLVERIHNGKEKIGVRDNVYFELGLYTGVLSKERSFFLFHKNCDVATDFCGITLPKYEDEEDVKRLCRTIQIKIEGEEQVSRVRLLPSTSLAVGYYENFLKDACREVNRLKGIEINNLYYNINEMEKQVTIIFPGSMTEDWREWAKCYYNDNHMIEIKFEHREDYPKSMTVRVDMEALKRGIFRTVDIPLTLRAAFKSVDLIEGKSCIGELEEWVKAKQREVKNFEKTIRLLANGDTIVKRLIDIEYIY